MPESARVTQKSNEKAEIARVNGNRFYCQRNFFDALINYNASLCHAKNGSENVGLAFANKSAVYYEMELYEKCICNIELAKENGYPVKNFDTLEKRKQKCFEKMQLENDVHDEKIRDLLSLSQESNPKIPFIAKCLELRTNRKFGRHIITNQDLKVGEIIAIEAPFFKVIKSDERYESCDESNKYQRCSHCLNSSLMDLIPCSECSSTMFCSDVCKKKAQSYHKYECAIIERLMKSGIMQMALRIFFTSLAIFDDSIEELQTFLSTELKDPSTTFFNFDNSCRRDEERNNLAAMYCLTGNAKNENLESLAKLLENNLVLKKNVWQENQNFIIEFLKKVISIQDSNFHGICGWSLKLENNKSASMIGVGCYPFLSLINHSCYPNVSRVYNNDRIYLMVDRPIRKGEQLFDCYKATFLIQPKIQRIMNLSQDYSFQCNCEACEKNYPQFFSLKVDSKTLHKVARKTKHEIDKLNSSEAFSKFKEIRKLLDENYKEFRPSPEFSILQECLINCVSIIMKPKILFP